MNARRSRADRAQIALVHVAGNDGGAAGADEPNGGIDGLDQWLARTGVEAPAHEGGVGRESADLDIFGAGAARQVFDHFAADAAERLRIRDTALERPCPTLLRPGGHERGGETGGGGRVGILVGEHLHAVGAGGVDPPDNLAGQPSRSADRGS